MKKIYTIALVEPSDIVSEGIKSILIKNKSFKVIYEAADFTQCIDRLPLLSPDIILINPKTIHQKENIQIRNTSSHLHNTLLIALVYDLFKDNLLQQFDGTISIYDNATELIATINKAIEQTKKEEQTTDFSYDLSEREIEILTLVAKGMTNKEIANQLNLSIYTVMSHRKNISKKTGIKTVSGLTVYAIINNWIQVS